LRFFLLAAPRVFSRNCGMIQEMTFSSLPSFPFFSSSDRQSDSERPPALLFFHRRPAWGDRNSPFSLFSPSLYSPPPFFFFRNRRTSGERRLLSSFFLSVIARYYSGFQAIPLRSRVFFFRLFLFRPGLTPHQVRQALPFFSPFFPSPPLFPFLSLSGDLLEAPVNQTPTGSSLSLGVSVERDIRDR